MVSFCGLVLTTSSMRSCSSCPMGTAVSFVQPNSCAHTGASQPLLQSPHLTFTVIHRCMAALIGNIDSNVAVQTKAVLAREGHECSGHAT